MQQPFLKGLFPGPTPQERSVELVALLRDRGWLTRRQIHDLTGWDDRSIRSAAEAAVDAKGRPAIVRGPMGFAVFERATVDAISHASEIAISQGKLMIRYGVGLKHRLHERIG